MRKLVWIAASAALLLAGCGAPQPEIVSQPGDIPFNMIPDLAMPLGASVLGGGGGGGGGGRQQGQGAGFEFNSDQSLAEIHQHFANQLADEGWEQKSEQSAEAEMVTFWEVYDSQGRTWAARLSVEQDGDSAPYAYWVRVEMLTP